MPIDKNEMRSTQGYFNSKFHTTFNYEKFKEKGKSCETATQWNRLYKETIASLYQQMVFRPPTNMYGFSDMLTDFQTDFIEPLINELRENDPEAIVPDVAAELSDAEWLDFAAEKLNAFPQTNADVYELEYLAGARRLRDMRVEVEFLNSSISPEDKKEFAHNVAGYVVALERANESRSLLWKIFHPIRNHAEKRDAAMMRAALEKAYPEETKSLYAQATTGKHPSISAHTNMLRESFEIQEKNNNKVSVEEQRRLDAEKELERKQIYERVTSIGYRPNISNQNELAKEYTMLEEIKSAFKIGKLTDPATQKISQTNKERCFSVFLPYMRGDANQMKSYFESHNAAGGKWEQADTLLREKFGEGYKPEPFDNLNREPFFIKEVAPQSEMKIEGNDIKLSEPVQNINKDDVQIDPNVLG